MHSVCLENAAREVLGGKQLELVVPNFVCDEEIGSGSFLYRLGLPFNRN